VPHNKRINPRKVKRCIFCGKTFKVKENLIKEAEYGEVVERNY